MSDNLCVEMHLSSPGLVASKVTENLHRVLKLLKRRIISNLFLEELKEIIHVLC